MIGSLESEPPIDLRRVSSEDACGDAVGWYYDNESQPTRIVFCERTCSTVANAREVLIDVQFPCL